MKKLVLVLVILSLEQFVLANSDQEAIRGIWSLAQDGTLIAIDVKDGAAEGVVLRRPNDRQDELDKYNPHPELRTRPILGLQVLKDLSFVSPGHWRGGSIYDPDSGETYSAQGKLEDNDTLVMRGYVGIPLLGKSTILKRVK